MDNGSTGNHAECSDSNRLKAFWRHIWRMKLPRKIKILVWRIYHDGLPVKVKLEKFGSASDAKCSICGFVKEDATHIFLDCWWSRSIWNLLNLDFLIPSYKLQNMADWLFSCHQILRDDELKCVFISLYFIWFHRNNREHGREFSSLHQICAKIRSYMKLCNCATVIFTNVEQQRSMHWSPPVVGEIKINTDGSFIQSSSKGGIGIIARGHDSSVALVWGECINGALNAMHTEGEALKKAMDIARRMGWTKVTFETDSTVLADGLIHGNTSLVHFQWFQACSSYLSKSQNWNISVILREANGAANDIARKCSLDSWSWTKVDAVPLCVRDMQTL